MGTTNFGTALGAAVRGAYCNWLGVNENAARWGANVGIPGSASYRRFIGAYRLGVCGNPDPLPDPQPTVVCPRATFYAVTSGTLFDGTTGGQGPQNAVGNPGNLVRSPFTGTETVRTNSFTSTTYLQGPFFPPRTEQLYVVQDDWINPRPYATFAPFPGEPNDCFFGPPPITPGTNFPIGPITINFNNDAGDPISLTGNLFIFAPIIGSFNELEVPLTLDLGGLTLNLNLDPNGNVDLRPPGFPSVGPSLDLPPPFGDPDPDPPDSERPIIGVMVSITGLNNQKATFIRQTNLPDLYVPRLARVQFRIKSGNNKAWTGEIPVKSKLAYIPCPVEGGAIAANVNAEIGVTLTFSKVYGVALPEAP